MRNHAFALVLLLALAGCVDIPSGAWTLRAPDGATFRTEVSVLRAGEYYVRAPGQTISGAYSYKNRELKIAKLDNPRMSGYVWRLMRRGELVLVEEPPAPISGVRMTSSTMKKTQN